MERLIQQQTNELRNLRNDFIDLSMNFDTTDSKEDFEYEGLKQDFEEIFLPSA